MVFKYNIKKKIYETDLDYIRRIKYIKMMNPKNEKSLNQVILLSMIMNNILNLHCVYPKKIQDELIISFKNLA